MRKANNPSRCVITPTFSGHFEYAINLLDSFDKFVKDKDKIDYVFILSSETEQKEFIKRLGDKYANVPWLKISNIEFILKKYGISETTDNMIKKIGRFSYQTIKKFYGMVYFNYDQYFVLDSESLFLKPMKLSKIFDRFFQDKFIFYSPTSAHNDPEYTKWLDCKTSVNCAKLLNFKFDNNWYFENFYWFYDINIVKDLFKYFDNNLFKAISDFSGSETEEFDKAIFEIILYNQFIRKNNKKYKYKFIDINEELINVLGKKRYDQMRCLMKKANQDALPYFIHGYEHLRFYDLIKISKLYRKYHLPVARLFAGGCQPRKVVIKAFILFTNIKIVAATDGVFICNRVINAKPLRRITIWLELLGRFFSNKRNRD